MVVIVVMLMGWGKKAYSPTLKLENYTFHVHSKLFSTKVTDITKGETEGDRGRNNLCLIQSSIKKFFANDFLLHTHMCIYAHAHQMERKSLRGYRFIARQKCGKEHP
jgi:hypothetical protein